MAWSGSIAVNDDLEVEDISIDLERLGGDAIPNGASLRYLSIVETSRIPLYLTLGSPCNVSTSNAESQRWFSHVLLAISPDSPNKGLAWWNYVARDSQIGILVSVDLSGTHFRASRPRTTEILFYASRKAHGGQAPPTPPNSSPLPVASGEDDGICLGVHALLLSSDLLEQCQPSEVTPPSSPQQKSCEAIFLPRLVEPAAEMINEPPVRKRKTANEAFDEANERRKKARRKGGEGVAAAAASKVEKQMPSLQHRRSGSASQAVPLQTRSLSRSPSVVSSRPTTANRPSGLSKVEDSANISEESAIERKNKDIISRVVMTGMRLHGLTQSKKRNANDTDVAASPAVSQDTQAVDAQRQNDEEYKVVYHQVFKSTCVAFRASIRQQNLQPFLLQIRDVVDQLLVIFCTNPLESGLGSLDDKLTPGGRKAFAASSRRDSEKQFHFPVK